MSLSSVRCVVFDLDGTIYRGNKLVDGASELLEFLGCQGIKVIYCTNNSTRTRLELWEKLTAFDLPASPEGIYSAAYAAAHYLHRNKYSKVFCIGTNGLRQELEAFDISMVSTPDEASVVLIGLDTKMNYEGMSSLLPLRNKSCKLVACNRDKLLPSDDGLVQLGGGFIVSLVEEVLEREVDYTVGKPNTYMLDMLIEEHEISLDETVVVGDSIESDIKMAQTAGCRYVYLSSQQDVQDVFQVMSLYELQALFT